MFDTEISAKYCHGLSNIAIEHTIYSEGISVRMAGLIIYSKRNFHNIEGLTSLDLFGKVAIARTNFFWLSVCQQSQNDTIHGATAGSST